MTPEERAERVLWGIIKPSIRKDGLITDGHANIVVNLVAAEIRQAVEEAISGPSFKELIERGLPKIKAAAKAEAYEDAAKIAETPISPDSKYYPGECYECDCHGECPQTYIATKIRAKAKEIK